MFDALSRVRAALARLDAALRAFGYVDGNIARVAKQIAVYSAVVRSHHNPLICETGFNAGHSAAVFLASGARYVGFDLGEWRYNKPAMRHLAANYPNAIEVEWGNSTLGIPRFFARSPSTVCDIVSIDGDHSCNGVVADYRLLAPHMRRGAVVLFDDSTYKSCHFAKLGLTEPLRCYAHNGWADTGLGAGRIAKPIASKGFCVYRPTATR
tara:strand:+ start:2666 stop:3295 length:630 start_codon:yes stop_codon:yes gene_type:complete